MGDVTLTDITKRFEDVVAVNDLNLYVEDGEFLTLVGPSGCGKSTTLETIAGLTHPTEGTVSIAGEEVTQLPPKDRDIAMVFQNIALFPHMNVYDNISFGLRLRKFDRDEIDRRVERATDILQLEDMAERMPDELSGGQRQRVAIGRAIVREPAVFLMDEPLANLDAKLRVHMRTELQRLHDQLGTTIVYVTHDQAEAMTMSDRIAVMNGGELQQVAPPLTCYNRPANLFVAGFIGSPSMNLVEGVLTDGGLRTDAFDVAFDPDEMSLSPGDRVTVDGDGLHTDRRTFHLDTSAVAAERGDRRTESGDGWSPIEAVVGDDGTSLRTDDGDRLPVDVSRFVQEVDDHLTLGVRPEDIYPVDVTHGPSDATDPIEVRVDVLEPMGDEVYVYLLTGEAEENEGVMAGDTATGSGQLLMSVDPATDISSDDRIEVVLDREHIHLFDADGDAIVHDLADPGSAAEQGQPAGSERSRDD